MKLEARVHKRVLRNKLLLIFLIASCTSVWYVCLLDYSYIGPRTIQKTRTEKRYGDNQTFERSANQSVKRTVSEELVYNKAVCVGSELIELMAVPDKSLQKTQRTQWTKYNEIEKLGWRKSKDEDQAVVNDDEISSAGPMLDALHLPPLTDKSWTKVVLEHTKKGQANGKTYPVS